MHQDLSRRRSLRSLGPHHTRLTSLTALPAVLATVATLLLLVASTSAAYRLGEQRSTRIAGPLPDAFAPLAETYERIERDAVRVPSDEALATGAVDGMLSALDDPYAAYYDAREFADLNDLLEGEFSGVGIVLQETPEGLQVADVLPDTPAALAGVEPGERIVTVDGRDVREAPVATVVDLVKGESGTTVRIGFEGGSAGPREVELTRAPIELQTLESRLLEDGAGYVRLLQFTERSGDDVRAAVEALAEQGARGIVLDLRGNPGGLLSEAVGVASVFIEDGPVVSVREREGEVRPLTAGGDAIDLPLVVLVDGGSASASEIVAAAIQDLGRGDVVGSTTFGKGTVQTVRVLSGGSGVKYTTAEYLTPSGDSIEGIGVVPDRVVPEGGDELAAAQEALRTLVAAG